MRRWGGAECAIGANPILQKCNSRTAVYPVNNSIIVIYNPIRQGTIRDNAEAANRDNGSEAAHVIIPVFPPLPCS